MTNYIADAVAEIIRTHQPDLVLATAITPMIYQSQETLKIVKQVCPQAKTVMGGVHPRGGLVGSPVGGLHYSRGGRRNYGQSGPGDRQRHGRTRSPKQLVDEVEQLVKEYPVGFFILVDDWTLDNFGFIPPQIDLSLNYHAHR